MRSIHCRDPQTSSLQLAELAALLAALDLNWLRSGPLNADLSQHCCLAIWLTPTPLIQLEPCPPTRLWPLEQLHDAQFALVADCASIEPLLSTDNGARVWATAAVTGEQ